MGYRTAHGAGAGALARVETAPADELPLGVPEEMPVDAGDASRPASETGGRFSAGDPRTLEAARRGGRRKAGKSKLASRLGFSTLTETAAFAPYKASAVSFRRAQCAHLAKTVGGGYCGPAPSSIVASAALALAWSRYFSDLAALSGDVDLAIKSTTLADKSRGALLTAHELCAREAQARPRAPHDPLAAFMVTKEGPTE